MPRPTKPVEQAPVGFWGYARTILLVTFLTVLIWLLAESRMVQTRMVELQLVLVGNTQDPEHRFVVRPTPGEVWKGSIDIELEGSLASLDQATRDLRGRVQLIVGDHIPSRVGQHELDLRTILRNIPPLRTHGVSIRSMSEDIARVQVDELVTIEMPVRVDLPANVALDGPVRAIPPTISVLGPSTQLAILEGREMLAAPVPGAIAQLTPGRLETIPGVALNYPVSIDPSLPAGWVPVLGPARVDIRLTIRSLTQTTTIDRLPIQLLIAPGEIGRWDVTLDAGSEDLVAVQISGPTNALNAIRDGSVVPSAVLALSYQELERGITSKRVEILGLPAGVAVVTEIPEISFTIVGTAQPPQAQPAQSSPEPATTTP